MKTTNYVVSNDPIAKNGYIDPSGYSKYYKRLELEHADTMNRIHGTNNSGLPKGELAYGYEQACEHLEEILRKEDEYTKDRRSKTWYVVKIVTTKSEAHKFNWEDK